MVGHILGLRDESYCNRDHDLSVIFARWLFIMKTFQSKSSCVGNEPPQSFEVAVARCQKLKSPNQEKAQIS